MEEIRNHAKPTKFEEALPYVIMGLGLATVVAGLAWAYADRDIKSDRLNEVRFYTGATTNSLENR